MGTIIQFPKNKRVAEFYKFLVKWSDGVIFRGNSLEECFRKQKDLFEPEISMNEYMEQFRKRLENVTGVFYNYRTVTGLINVLKENDYLEVLVWNGDNEYDPKFS